MGRTQEGAFSKAGAKDLPTFKVLAKSPLEGWLLHWYRASSASIRVCYSTKAQALSSLGPSIQR